MKSFISPEARAAILRSKADEIKLSIRQYYREKLAQAGISGDRELEKHLNAEMKNEIEKKLQELYGKESEGGVEAKLW